LGRDVEVKYTTSGTPVATFSLATSSSFKNKNGDYEDRVEWHNVKAWSRLAEIAGEFLKKGSKVYIQGRLETESWSDKQTDKKMYKTVIVAQELIMLDSKGGDKGDHEERSESRSSGRGQDRGFDSPRGGSAPKQQEEEFTGATDADIPFLFADESVPQCPRAWRRRLA
jgi:single-strand DNA-binding protein